MINQDIVVVMYMLVMVCFRVILQLVSMSKKGLILSHMMKEAIVFQVLM